jgi:hypothetical protein
MGGTTGDDDTVHRGTRAVERAGPVRNRAGPARDAADRCEELRLECLGAQIEAEAALGHHADVVAELADVVGVGSLSVARWCRWLRPRDVTR